MNLYHFVERQRPCLINANGELPHTGFLWADFERGEAVDWPCWVEPKVGAVIDSQHVEDSLNAQHPSFFDGTSDYDMTIFQGLGPNPAPLPLETRSSAFFVFDRMLVTVRPNDSLSIERVRQRLLDGRAKAPTSPMRLMYLFLDTMVDRFLAIREPMDQQLTALQDDLIDPHEPLDDWRDLLSARRQMRQLQGLCESQLDALECWRRDSRFDWKQADEVRYRDLSGHVGRVLNHAVSLEHDLESAVQLHFAAVSHRTNRVMQTLTVLSAIFFPLTLVVGIYGMNFDNMPELHWRYGYFAALGLLAVIAASLWRYFKRRHLI